MLVWRWFFIDTKIGFLKIFYLICHPRIQKYTSSMITNHVRKPSRRSICMFNYFSSIRFRMGELIVKYIFVFRLFTEQRILGFDCEWVTKNGSRHPVALIQLASSNGECTLIRLSKIQYVPRELKVSRKYIFCCLLVLK